MKTRVRWPISLTLLMFLCLSESLVYAQSTIAVLGVDAGDAPADLAFRLGEAIRDQIKESPELKLSPGKSLDEIKLVFGCIDERPDCMARAGQSMQVSKVIWGTLKRVPRGYDFTIKLLDVTGIRIESFVSRVITVSDLKGQGTRAVVEQMARSFLTVNRGKIKLTCNVSNAQIFLGSNPMGICGEDGLLIPNVLPGTHEIAVKKEGYQIWTQIIPVERGQTTDVEVVLKKREKITPALQVQPTSNTTLPLEEEQTNGWKIAFWSSAVASLGVAVGGIITGVQVLNVQKDKDQLLQQEQYKQDPRSKSSDVCATNGSGWPSTDLKSICDKGNNRATLTTALWASFGGLAIVSGIFYYKAYISTDETHSTGMEKSTRESSATHHPKISAKPLPWTLVPTISSEGGFLDLSLRF